MVIYDSGKSPGAPFGEEALRKKLAAYLIFVRSSQLRERYPEVAEDEVFVRVICKLPPTATMARIESVYDSDSPDMRAADVPSRSGRLTPGPLLASTGGGQSTLIEGSGRFVGESPTGAVNGAQDNVADGVPLNLVNVPAPQAAKTFLGDICRCATPSTPASTARSRSRPQNQYRDWRSSICSRRRAPLQ